MAAAGTLTAANDRAHRGIEARLVATAEALLDRHPRAARRRFRVFAASLAAHMEAEDDWILPWFRELADSDAARLVERVAGDHVVLERVVARAHTALARLEPTSPRLGRDIVDALEPLLRVRRVLAHHDARERATLYPRLDRWLGPGTRRAAADALARSAPCASRRPAPGSVRPGA